MDDANIEGRLLDMEALVLDTLRSLSEIEDVEAVRLGADEIARQQEALARLNRALDQFEQLATFVDIAPPRAARH